jgi:hypothetical protein
MSRVASRANSSPICQIQLRRICLTRGLREAEQQMGWSPAVPKADAPEGVCSWLSIAMRLDKGVAVEAEQAS